MASGTMIGHGGGYKSRHHLVPAPLLPIASSLAPFRLWFLVCLPENMSFKPDQSWIYLVTRQLLGRRELGVDAAGFIARGLWRNLLNIVRFHDERMLDKYMTLLCEIF